jgi:hypothetical protein
VTELLTPERENALLAAEAVLDERLRTGYELALASCENDEMRRGVERCWQHIGASHGDAWAHASAVLDAALPHLPGPS